MQRKPSRRAQEKSSSADYEDFVTPVKVDQATMRDHLRSLKCWDTKSSVNKFDFIEEQYNTAALKVADIAETGCQ